VQSEGSSLAARADECDVGRCAIGQAAAEQHLHAEVRRRRSDRVGQLEIEKSLVVVDLCVLRDFRAAHVRNRKLERLERFVRRQGNAPVGHLVLHQTFAVFHQHDAVGHLVGGFAHRRVDVRKRQISRSIFRKARFSQREQWDTEQHLQLCGLGPQIGLNNNLIRDVVRAYRRLNGQEEQRGPEQAKSGPLDSLHL
jgi:hypothetical protein